MGCRQCTPADSHIGGPDGSGPHSRDRGNRPRQVVRRNARGRRRRSPRPARRGLRRAGPQWRRQDDDDPHAGDVDPSGCGHGPGPWIRHRQRGRRRSGRRQPHRPARIRGRGSHGAREPDPARPPAGAQAPVGQGPCRRAARCLWAVRGRGAARQELLGRDATQARHRREHRGHPAADVPRRADERPRPALAQPGLGHHPGAGRGGDDDPALHSVPGGGRPACRPDRRHRPRQGDRRGDAGPAQSLARLRLAARAPAGPRATPRSRAGAGPRAGRGLPRARPCRPVGLVRGRRSGRRGGRGAVSLRGADRRILARPAEPRRGLPGADRTPAASGPGRASRGSW